MSDDDFVKTELQEAKEEIKMLDDHIVKLKECARAKTLDSDSLGDAITLFCTNTPNEAQVLQMIDNLEEKKEV